MTQSHNICIIFTIHFRQIGRQINRQIDRSCCVRLIFYMHIIQDGFMIKKQRINSFIDKQNILKHKINHNFCKKILINLINEPFFLNIGKPFFLIIKHYIQGYPQRTRLQIRFVWDGLMHSGFLAGQNWHISVLSQ